jgi:hypothetical protein
MGRKYRMHWGHETYTKLLSKNAEGKNGVGDLDVHVRIILKCIL